jgi:hypothetical protein
LLKLEPPTVSMIALLNLIPLPLYNLIL